MLSLGQSKGDRIFLIGEDQGGKFIFTEIVNITGPQIKVGFKAGDDITILRERVLQQTEWGRQILMEWDNAE